MPHWINSVCDSKMLNTLSSFGKDAMLISFQLTLGLMEISSFQDKAEIENHNETHVIRNDETLV